MDEKEAIQFVKDSFADKKTRAEITRAFQQKGYKLEYINAIIKKAKRKRKIIINLSVFFALLLSVTFFLSSIYLFNQKTNLENPLSNINLNTPKNLNNFEENISEITITPDFIVYTLNELGAWKLHKNPLTLEKPVINLEISGVEFYALIGNEIMAKEGTNKDADIKFIFEKKQIIEAMLAENLVEYIKEKLEIGEAQIETLTDDKELFAKGYLSLYNSLTE